MSDPAPFLAVARTALDHLRKEGLDYRLSGSLALHAHGVRNAALSRDIILVTENDYEAGKAGGALANRSHQERQFTLEGRGAGSGVTTLVVSSPDPRQTATLSLQRLPQGAPAQDVGGIPTVPLEGCLYRTLDLLHSRNEAADFIDVDALQHHAGPDMFDLLVSAYLRDRAQADPTISWATHAGLLFDRLTLVMRHTDELLGHYGHPAPEDLRTSLLRAAGRMMEPVPEAAWMFQMPLPHLKYAERMEITAQFDAAMAAAIPVDWEVAAQREARIRAIRTAMEIRQDESRRREAAAPGSRRVHPDHHHPSVQEPVNRSGFSPGR